MRAQAVVVHSVAEGPRLSEIEVDEPRDGEVLVRVAASGICGSDLHVVHGRSVIDAFPMVLGPRGIGSGGGDRRRRQRPRRRRPRRARALRPVPWVQRMPHRALRAVRRRGARLGDQRAHGRWLDAPAARRRRRAVSDGRRRQPRGAGGPARGSGGEGRSHDSARPDLSRGLRRHDGSWRSVQRGRRAARRVGGSGRVWRRRPERGAGSPPRQNDDYRRRSNTNPEAPVSRWSYRGATRAVNSNILGVVDAVHRRTRRRRRRVRGGRRATARCRRLPRDANGRPVRDSRLATRQCGPIRSTAGRSSAGGNCSGTTGGSSVPARDIRIAALYRDGRLDLPTRCLARRPLRDFAESIAETERGEVARSVVIMES